MCGIPPVKTSKKVAIALSKPAFIMSDDICFKATLNWFCLKMELSSILAKAPVSLDFLANCSNSKGNKSSGFSIPFFCKSITAAVSATPYLFLAMS